MKTAPLRTALLNVAPVLLHTAVFMLRSAGQVNRLAGALLNKTAAAACRKADGLKATRR